MSTANDKIQDKITKAKARLLLDKAFYGSMVCNRHIVLDPQVPTASCSAKGLIRINPVFAAELNVNQLAFLLAHETMHYILAHAARVGGRDRERWNYAADAVINDMLLAHKVGEFIDGVVEWPGAREQTAEDIYRMLPENGGGEGQTPGGIGQDLSTEDGPLDEAEAEAIQAKARVEVLQAAKAAKARGDLPAGLQRLIDELTVVKTPWYDVLAQYMHNLSQESLSWSRPNRRLYASGVYLPGKRADAALGTVVIAVDTSGSIGEKELAEFYGHINAILETCRPEKTIVIQCDAAVSQVDEYLPEDLPIKPQSVAGGGGTSFVPVFDWVEDNGVVPDVLVYLTDGYGDQQLLTAPDYPVVWLTTGIKDFPFGRVVEYVG